MESRYYMITAERRGDCFLAYGPYSTEAEAREKHGDGATVTVAIISEDECRREPGWSDETGAQDDISERYAGEVIPPFDHDPDANPWTGEPLKPLIVLLTPDI